MYRCKINRRKVHGCEEERVEVLRCKEERGVGGIKERAWGGIVMH